MATLDGKNVVVLIRNLEDEATDAADYIALQTEYSKTISTEVNETITKDGTQKSHSPSTTELTLSFLAQDDDGVIDAVEDGMHTGETYGFWEINKGAKDESGKFKAIYFEGSINNFEFSANAEESATINMDIAINGYGKRGYATLTEEQEAYVDYVFKDTTTAGV